MIRNLFLTALRTLVKNRLFTILNIVGLSLGIAVLLLIVQYVHFEKSYENFIVDADNIYRVSLTTVINGELAIASAENYPGVGPALKNELPEVLDYARLYNMGYKNNVIITYEAATPDPIALKVRGFMYADSSFLKMMDYPMVEGDGTTALAEPFTAVISARYAKIYFGDESAIGKMLRLQDDDYNNELVTVTGVMDDLPENTHLKFDVLFSYRTLLARRPDRGNWAVERYDESWQRKDMYTFLRVQPGTDPNDLEAKFSKIVEKFNPSLKERNQQDILALQPLKSIHLNSNLAEEPEANGDARIVMFLGLLGFFVILIAWINYVNLSTAKAMDRAKEVGVRKVMGAIKWELIRQFLVESAVINLIAVIIAFTVSILVLPHFNALAGAHFEAADFTAPWFLLLVAALWIAGTLLSGFYPAVVLSSFKPVTILKGQLRNSTRGILLRKTLVVVQFMASLALIAGTMIVYRQLNHMMQSDLGIDINQVMVVERPGISPRDRNAFYSVIDVFRDEVKKDPDVQGLAASVTIPGKQREYKSAVKRYGAADDQLVTIRFNSMDYEFMDVFRLNLVAGRPFSPHYTNDPDTAVILTQSAVRLLGYDNPESAIGQTISAQEFNFNAIVVGVVNDYHQVSLKKSLDPTLFYCSPYYGEFYSIRVNTTDLTHTVEHIRTAWQKAFPGNPFDYFFLDQYFNHQYENERKFGKLFTTFSVLAVIVGCLGLFGLSSYSAAQRTKEIGVRKVLGSTVGGIFLLLSAEYIRLILLSIALAVPVVWFTMKAWMERFPYRTSLSIDVFIIAGTIILLVSLITVSFQTIKAARSNPVDSLKYE